jgi:hypothetical protein
LEHEDGRDVDAKEGQRDGSGGRSVDDRRIGGFRGPLVFGVVAATLEMAVILVLLYC